MKIIIAEEMKLAVVYAVASVISDEQLREDYFIPDVFHSEVIKKEADAVAKASRESGVARI